MQKSSKTILIIVIVIGLLLCLCIAGILAAIGIPALMSTKQTTTITEPKTETDTYETSAEEWNSTISDASDLASDLHLKLTDITLTRLDVVYPLLNGDKAAFTKSAGDFSEQLVDLEKALQDSQDQNDKRAAIADDLKTSTEGDASSLQKSYVDKAAETVDQEKAILDEYAAVLELLKEEQTWYDKALAGTAETTVIRPAIDKLSAQLTDKVTVIGDLKLKFNPLGQIPVS